MKPKLLAILLVILLPIFANAQLRGLVNKVKNKVDQRIDNKVDQQADKTLDEIEEKKSTDQELAAGIESVYGLMNQLAKEAKAFTSTAKSYQRQFESIATGK